MRTGRVVWEGDTVLRGEVRGHTVTMDTRRDDTSRGPSAKDLTMLSIGGCTAVDVVSILEKMRQPLEGLEIDLRVEETEEPPKVFGQVEILYKVRGEGLDPKKVLRAVNLSMEKYCGVSAMIKKSARVTYAVELNGQRLEPSPKQA